MKKIMILILLTSCGTFETKTFDIINHQGKIKVHALNSYNHGPVEGSDVNVIMQKGQLRGSGKLLSGEIKNSSGDIDIFIDNVGNLGYQEYR